MIESDRKFKAQADHKTEKSVDKYSSLKEKKKKVFDERNWLIHNVKVIQYCC